MSKQGPVLLIDDDEDDFELFTQVFTEEGISNQLLHFSDGKRALDYLTTTTDSPLLILSDINMPKIGGIELRAIISEDETLKHKSIPFIFFTTSGAEHAVKQAYDLCVQGFFVKGDTLRELAKQVKLIIDYWKEAMHPSNFSVMKSL